LSLGGHVELPDKIFHKPAARLCREQSWRRRKRFTFDEMTFLLVRFDHIAGFARPRDTARRVTVSREWIGLRTLAG
jgi:hypothetical protein